MSNDKLKKGCYRLAMKAKKRDMSVSIFGLEKVPAEPLLRMALEEIGEQESYIEEPHRGTARPRREIHPQECVGVSDRCFKTQNNRLCVNICGVLMTLRQ